MRAPAKWVVSETTNNGVTFEYAREITGYPNWAVRVIAFHEVCHVKHALKGLPLLILCLKGDDKEESGFSSLPLAKATDFNFKEIDVKILGNILGVEAKKTMDIIQDAYVMLTDVLVNCELIKHTPVGSENLEYGNITVFGDSKMVDKPTCEKDRFNGVIEAGLWRAVTEKIGPTYPASKSALIERLADLEFSFRNYGVSAETYNQYVKTLLNVEFTTCSKTLENLLFDVCKAILRIESQIVNVKNS